jgi:hypothetical protein
MTYHTAKKLATVAKKTGLFHRANPVQFNTVKEGWGIRIRITKTDGETMINENDALDFIENISAMSGMMEGEK